MSEVNVEYNPGNYEKYKTKNPLKHAMVERLNVKIMSVISKFIEGHNDARLLDAGCGEGFIDNLILQKYPNVQITGVEYTAEALQIAKNLNPGVKYIQGDICHIAFENDSYDYVICTEVLEHLAKPKEALKELMRVCKKGILITVPHEPWFCLGNMLVLKNITKLGNPIDHVNHWTKSSFSTFLKENANKIPVEGWNIDTSFPWILATYDMERWL